MLCRATLRCRGLLCLASLRGGAAHFWARAFASRYPFARLSTGRGESASYQIRRWFHGLWGLCSELRGKISVPADFLFVDTAVYCWRALDELAGSACYVGERAQGRVAFERLHKERSFPGSEQARIEANPSFYGL